MSFQALLVCAVIVVCSAKYWPEPTCTKSDDALCVLAITANNIDQCYQTDIETHLCCHHCKSFRNKAKPHCPYGDVKQGIIKSDKRYSCSVITPTTCLYCTSSRLGRENCCGSCEQKCGRTLEKKTEAVKKSTLDELSRLVRVLADSVSKPESKLARAAGRADWPE